MELLVALAVMSAWLPVAPYHTAAVVHGRGPSTTVITTNECTFRLTSTPNGQSNILVIGDNCSLTTTYAPLVHK